MDVRIKRFDKDIPLPARKTAGAAAFDLHARETVTIQPRTIGYIPLNIALEIPADHFLLVAARSGTHKRGLMLANGIGIIDSDFRGDKDEINGVYYNFTDAPVTIDKGDRIAQATFVPVTKLAWQEVDQLESNDRGAFGTTGNK